MTDLRSPDKAPYGSDCPVQAELAEVKTDIAGLKAEVANLATKADLAEVKAELKSDIANILKWMVGAIGFQTAAPFGTVVGLVKISAK